MNVYESGRKSLDKLFPIYWQVIWDHLIILDEFRIDIQLNLVRHINLHGLFNGKDISSVL